MIYPSSKESIKFQKSTIPFIIIVDKMISYFLK